MVSAGVLLIAVVAARPDARTIGSSTGREALVPPELEAAVHRVLPLDRCTTSGRAKAEISTELVELGYSDWSVAPPPAGNASRCVVASIDGPSRKIRLIPALSPAVRERLERLTTELIDNCFSRAESEDHLREALTNLGEAGFEIRAGGPVTAPVDRIDDVRRRIEAGCVTYSGTGWTEDGLRLYYLAGG